MNTHERTEVYGNLKSIHVASCSVPAFSLDLRINNLLKTVVHHWTLEEIWLRQFNVKNFLISCRVARQSMAYGVYFTVLLLNGKSIYFVVFKVVNCLSVLGERTNYLFYYSEPSLSVLLESV